MKRLSRTELALIVIPVLVLPLLLGASTNSTGRREIRSYDLGVVHRNHLSAQVFFANDVPGDFGEFEACFYISRLKTRKLIAKREAGCGLLSEVQIRAEPFVGNRRRQIFISAEMGAITTRLFDCDGRVVRTLYADTGGRVRIHSISRSRRWKCRIVEDWPPRQYSDEKSLGDGYIAGGMIRRTLHWNGRAFVADHPGPTRVFRAGHWLTGRAIDAV